MTVTVTTGDRGPSTLALLVGQIRYQLLMMWRIPIALFFTLVFPLVMLLMFNAVFGGETITTDGGNEIPITQFFTGGLAVFTAVSATYTNLANMVPLRRDEGILKRWRGTPLPASVYLGGFIGQAVVLAAIGMAIMIGIGVVAYDVHLDAAKVPFLLAAFVIGVAAFGALGMAVASVVPNASSSAAVANATLLPLAFISDVFLPSDDMPPWLSTVGDLFPLKPFVEAILDVFDPALTFGDMSWTRLGYLAVWGVVGAVLAVRFFRWEPAPGGPGRRRQRDT